MQNVITKLVAEAIRVGYKKIALLATSHGLYVTVVETEKHSSKAIQSTLRCENTLLHMDDDEFTKLAESVYDVGWLLFRKGVSYHLMPHDDAAGRAAMSHRWAAMIEPLQKEMAAHAANFQ